MPLHEQQATGEVRLKLKTSKLAVELQAVWQSTAAKFRKRAVPLTKPRGGFYIWWFVSGGLKRQIHGSVGKLQRGQGIWNLNISSRVAGFRELLN